MPRQRHPLVDGDGWMLVDDNVLAEHTRVGECRHRLAVDQLSTRTCVALPAVGKRGRDDVITGFVVSSPRNRSLPGLSDPDTCSTGQAAAGRAHLSRSERVRKIRARAETSRVPIADGSVTRGEPSGDEQRAGSRASRVPPSLVDGVTRSLGLLRGSWCRCRGTTRPACRRAAARCRRRRASR